VNPMSTSFLWRPEIKFPRDLVSQWTMGGCFPLSDVSRLVVSFQKHAEALSIHDKIASLTKTTVPYELTRVITESLRQISICDPFGDGAKQPDLVILVYMGSRTGRESESRAFLIPEWFVTDRFWRLDSANYVNHHRGAGCD